MSDKANVLVMGNSGAGKSTLINSVFNFDKAPVGEGDPVTQRMTIYETKDIGFRVIDTKGLEYGFIAQMQTRNSIKKWSKDSVKKSDEGKYIHIIWYCIDATSKRIFDKSLESLRKVSKYWKNVPIIIVLTKSYSEIENKNNINMVKSNLLKYEEKKYFNIVNIIPVVAKQYEINTETFVPPVNVDQLIDITNDIIPEALRTNKENIGILKMKIKRRNANALVGLATSGAAVIGAVPIPFSDSFLLMPIQSGMIIGLSKIYGIKNFDVDYKDIIQKIVECGVVSAGAKNIVSAIKLIPGVNLAAAIINAIVAGIITAIIGEVTIVVMEKIVREEVDPKDLDWLQKIIESEFMNRLDKYIGKLGKDFEGKDEKEIGKIISEMFKEMNGFRSK